MTRFINCSDCGEYIPHYAKGLCDKCYKKCYHKGRYKKRYRTKKYRLKLDEYYYIYKPHFKYSHKDGYVQEHRYIYHIYLSIKYNRIIYLPKKYDVHHINGNKLDNRINNLEIISHSNHLKIHNPIIDKSDRYCNLCNTKETSKKLIRGKYYDNWTVDINGFLCDICSRMIRYYRKNFEIISNYKYTMKI